MLSGLSGFRLGKLIPVVEVLCCTESHICTLTKLFISAQCRSLMGVVCCFLIGPCSKQCSTSGQPVNRRAAYSQLFTFGNCQHQHNQHVIFNLTDTDSGQSQ